MGSFISYAPGHKFPDTRLTYLEEGNKRQNKIRYIKVRCDCGTIFETSQSGAKSKKTTSCGCYKRDRTVEANKKERPWHKGELNYRFPNSRLTFVQEEPRSETGKYQIRVRCDCGNERVMVIGNVLNGHTTSCGCYKKDTAGQHKIKHGYSTDPEFSYIVTLWHHILERTEKHPAYIKKGIKVHHRWKGEDGFMYFLNYVMTILGHRPTDKHSLDRKDNNKGYEPGNLKWATQQEQTSNTERTIYLTMKGETKPFSVWCQELNVARHVVRKRIDNGWDHEEALTKPVETKFRNKNYSPKLMPGV